MQPSNCIQLIIVFVYFFNNITKIVFVIVNNLLNCRIKNVRIWSLKTRTYIYLIKIQQSFQNHIIIINIIFVIIMAGLNVVVVQKLSRLDNNGRLNMMIGFRSETLVTYHIFLRSISVNV